MILTLVPVLTGNVVLLTVPFAISSSLHVFTDGILFNVNLPQKVSLPLVRQLKLHLLFELLLQKVKLLIELFHYLFDYYL